MTLHKYSLTFKESNELPVNSSSDQTLPCISYEIQTMTRCVNSQMTVKIDFVVSNMEKSILGIMKPRKANSMKINDLIMK